MIAIDSVRCVPSASSRTGRRPKGLRARCSGLRCWPARRSTCHLFEIDASAARQLLGEIETHARRIRRDREDVEPHRAILARIAPIRSCGRGNLVRHQRSVHGATDARQEASARTLARRGRCRGARAHAAPARSRFTARASRSRASAACSARSTARCNHAGGPLGSGTLEGEYVVCPWHQWRFHRSEGHGERGFEQDVVPAYRVRVRGGRVEVSVTPHVKRQRKQHDASPAGARAAARSRARARGRHLDHGDERRLSALLDLRRAARSGARARARELGCGTQRIRLRELSFRHCEGYYSKAARACTWPCSITQMDPDDQLDRVYEALVHWADVFVIATPIRWGGPSSLYFKMIERMNCIQNQLTIAGRTLLEDKVLTAIITGGQDNIQSVAGQMLGFFTELGCHIPQYPYIAHSRGWSAEDMERNVAVVQRSEELRMAAARARRTRRRAGAAAARDRGEGAEPRRPQGPAAAQRGGGAGGARGRHAGGGGHACALKRTGRRRVFASPRPCWPPPRVRGAGPRAGRGGDPRCRRADAREPERHHARARARAAEAGQCALRRREPLHRDLLAQMHATAAGQYPFASIVGCIDSRVPPSWCSTRGSATCSARGSRATSSTRRSSARSNSLRSSPARV